MSDIAPLHAQVASPEFDEQSVPRTDEITGLGRWRVAWSEFWTKERKGPGDFLVDPIIARRPTAPSRSGS